MIYVIIHVRKTFCINRKCITGEKKTYFLVIQFSKNTHEDCVFFNVMYN